MKPTFRESASQQSRCLGFRGREMPSITLLQVAPEDAAILRGLSPEDLHEVNVLAYHSWDMNRHRIAGVRFSDGVLQFTGGGGQPFFQPEPYQRLQFENFRGAMDAPGEWFLARDSTLIYPARPGAQVS